MEEVSGFIGTAKDGGVSYEGRDDDVDRCAEMLILS